MPLRYRVSHVVPRAGARGLALNAPVMVGDWNRPKQKVGDDGQPDDLPQRWTIGFFCRHGDPPQELLPVTDGSYCAACGVDPTGVRIVGWSNGRFLPADAPTGSGLNSPGFIASHAVYWKAPSGDGNNNRAARFPLRPKGDQIIGDRIPNGSAALAINANGDVVGEVTRTGVGPVRAGACWQLDSEFVATMRGLHGDGGHEVFWNAVSPGGSLIGHVGFRAAIKLPGKRSSSEGPMLLPILSDQGFGLSMARGATSLDVLCGYSGVLASNPAKPEHTKALLWSPDSQFQLSTLLGLTDGGASAALAISDAGLIVGTAEIAATMRAVVWPDATSRPLDLNGLLVDGAGKLTLLQAVGVNEDGWIAANGVVSNSEVLDTDDTVAVAVLLEPR